MNVGIYVRVSTEEQRDFGYSIDAQIREINEYCEKRNLRIIDTYNDAGHSAKDLNRPEMERMIKDIKNGKINCVISMKVDRLTREGYDGQCPKFIYFYPIYSCTRFFLENPLCVHKKRAITTLIKNSFLLNLIYYNKLLINPNVTLKNIF